jgi:hypothetical protein
MTDAEDADDSALGVELVDHAVVANPDSVDMLCADQLSAPHRGRVEGQAFNRSDDTRYLLAV